MSLHLPKQYTEHNLSSLGLFSTNNTELCYNKVIQMEVVQICKDTKFSE